MRITSYGNDRKPEEEPYFAIDGVQYFNNDRVSMFAVIRFIWELFRTKQVTACEIMDDLLSLYGNSVTVNKFTTREIIIKKKSDV